MNNVWILASARIVNGEGDLDECYRLEQAMRQQGAGCVTLTIEPLKSDWHAALAPGHYRSGCGPLEALAEARRLIREGEAQAVVIEGRDYLASEYTREERRERMAIYGDEYPLTRGYDDLAAEFITQRGIDQDIFNHCRDALFRNYQRSYERRLGGAGSTPDARWFEPVTTHFRGVDCANPVMDFEGRVVLGGDDLLQNLSLNSLEPLALEAVGLGSLPIDGPEAIPAIARYDHLRQAFLDCQEQAGEDLIEAVRREAFLLELYTCYPVVPLGFLVASGLITRVDEAPALLETLPVTVSGGMNLARAPWNNPALNGLIILCEQIRRQHKAGGILHGNGGLGYRQGVALLRRKNSLSAQ